MASLVYLHNKSNGVTYVYSNHSYRDKETHKVKHERKCIGHLDPETGKVVPNRQRKTNAKAPEPADACKVEDIGLYVSRECCQAIWYGTYPEGDIPQRLESNADVCILSCQRRAFTMPRRAVVFICQNTFWRPPWRPAHQRAADTYYR